MDIYLDIYGYQYEYPWIFMDIHAWTCYGFSIQGRALIKKIVVCVRSYDGYFVIEIFF